MILNISCRGDATEEECDDDCKRQANCVSGKSSKMRKINFPLLRYSFYEITNFCNILKAEFRSIYKITSKCYFC